MSTMEHLFMEIFDRRRSIEAQLRQQAESYSESLASNLLAHGCRPPPWLLASGSESAAGFDPKEMNREQLISGILFPPPRFTTPSANHKSLFTLLSLRGDNILQSSYTFTGACALDQSVPNNCPKAREQGSDVPVESPTAEGHDGVDPLACIQRSRSRQRDLETRLHKKQRTSKHEVATSSMRVDGINGRMTRSKAAALKSDNAKTGLEPKNLLASNLDGCKVTRSRARKLKSPDKLSKPEESSIPMEDGIPVAVEAQTDICSASSIVAENIENNGIGAAIQSCAVETEESENAGRVVSPACFGLETGNAAGLRMSDFKSVVEPKQLYFDVVVEECGPPSISAKGSEKVTPGISDVMDVSQSKVLQTAAVEFPFQNFSGGDDPFVTKKFQGEDALPTSEIICTMDRSIWVTDKNLELERVDCNDSGCASHPSPVPESLSHRCGSSSEPKCGSSENKLQHFPVGDCALGSLKKLPPDFSNLQDAYGKGSLECRVQRMTCREIQGSSSGSSLLKTGVLKSAEGRFNKQNFEAHNSSQTRWLHEDDLWDCEQINNRMPEGGPANIQSGAKFPVVDNPEQASCFTGQLDDLQVASGCPLVCLGQFVRKDGSASTEASKPLETNGSAEAIHFSSNVISDTTFEKEDFTISESVPIVEVKKKCGHLNSKDGFLANSQLAGADTLHTTEVVSCFKEANSASHGGCERFGFHAREEPECNSQSKIESRIASQVLDLPSLTTMAGVCENNSASPSSSGVCLSKEDRLSSKHMDLSHHVMFVHDDRSERTLPCAVQTVRDECLDRIIKRKTGSIVPQFANSSLSDTSLSHETHPVLTDAEGSCAAAIGESRVTEPTITHTSDTAQKAVLKVTQFSRNSNVLDEGRGCLVNSSKRVGNCSESQGIISDSNPKDFQEKHVTGETPNSGDVPHLLPEACPLSTNSVSVKDKYDSCRRSVEQDKFTPSGTGSQNAPPQNRYSLRSLTINLKNSASYESNEINVASSMKPAFRATDDACEITWSKRRKIDQSDDIFATSHRMSSKLLPSKEGNDHIFKTTTENGSIAPMEVETLQLSTEAEADLPGVASRGTSENLHKDKKKCLTEGVDCLKGRVEVEITNTFAPSVHSLVESFGDFRDSVKDKVKNTESFSLDQESNLTPLGCRNSQLPQNALENSTLRKSVNLGKFNDLMSTHDGKELLHTRDSVWLSAYGDDKFGCDEAMPEFEGFSIAFPSSTEFEVAVNDSDFSALTEKRASLLEQLCQSGSVVTPLSRPLTKYKINDIPDVYQSLPSRLPDHMRLSNSFELHNIGMTHIRASKDARITSLYGNLGSEFDASLSCRSLSQSISSSSTRFGSVVRKPPLTPPVGKMSQRVISGRSFASSEKVGSNPELICFRIDENSCMTEENEHPLGLEDTSKEKVGSGNAMVSNNRKALGDVTSSYRNAQSLVSGSKNFPERGSLDSVNTELYFQTRTELCPGMEIKRADDDRLKADDKENSFLSVGDNGIKKPIESLCRVPSKPDLFTKGKERITSHTTLEKGGKPSNIVSSISSFIPLVRQTQQAVAPAAGKRDVKVKALEAAEAAKRLEEKRQNDRAMRKAAAKLERERLEQENAKLLELQQKQKEEARKKKEAEIAARKRQREDEERKEKEKKRKCMHETKKPQRLGGERLHAGKDGKKLRQKAADDKGLRKKELAEDGRQQKNLDTHKEVSGCMEAAELEPSITEVLDVDNRHGNHSSEANDSVKESNNVVKAHSNLDNMQAAIQDRMSFTKVSGDILSYEISPYKDSDDEDGEEDTRRKMKRVPSWARKECLKQLLLSKQHIDPVEVFARKSSFNLSEVLSPRILRRPLSQLR
ncbi:putative inner centromere ARK-binding protein [Dioscorea sansibarensis]